MKNALYFLSFVVVATFFLSSCSSVSNIARVSVEKRKYRDGYTVRVERRSNVGAKQYRHSVSPRDNDSLAVSSTDTCEPLYAVSTSEGLTACTAPQFDQSPVHSKGMASHIVANTSRTVKSIRQLYTSDVSSVEEFRNHCKQIKNDYKHENQQFLESQESQKRGGGGGFGLGIAALIFAVLGLVMWRLLFGILAIVFGAMAMGRGAFMLGVISLVIGIIDLLLWLAVL